MNAIRFVALVALCSSVLQVNGGYLMYVWNRKFNNTLCSTFASKTDASNCYTDAWKTESTAKDLIAASTVPGREVELLLLSEVTSILSPTATGNCGGSMIPAVKSFLRMAHQQNLTVYALFAASNSAFSEKFFIPYVVSYNQFCASSAEERFDGVSVNNEYYSNVKCSNEAAELKFLDDIYASKVAAQGLPLHMSFGWHWSWCSVSGAVPNMKTWGPAGSNSSVSKNFAQHVMDITDSVDVQVAWNTPATMMSRALSFGFGYVSPNATTAKPFYILAYLNPTSDCRTSFSPVPATCSTGDRTEAGMYAAFDAITGAGSATPGARGGIHYYGGAYSAGIPGWPAHVAPSPAVTSAPPNATANSTTATPSPSPNSTLPPSSSAHINWTATPSPSSNSTLPPSASPPGNSTLSIQVPCLPVLHTGVPSAVTVPAGTLSPIALPTPLSWPMPRTRFTSPLRLVNGNPFYTVSSLSLSLEGMRHATASALSLTLSHAGRSVAVFTLPPCAMGNASDLTAAATTGTTTTATTTASSSTSTTTTSSNVYALQGSGANYTFAAHATAQPSCGNGVLLSRHPIHAPALAAFAGHNWTSGGWNVTLSTAAGAGTAAGGATQEQLRGYFSNIVLRIRDDRYPWAQTVFALPLTAKLLGIPPGAVLQAPAVANSYPVSVTATSPAGVPTVWYSPPGTPPTTATTATANGTVASVVVFYTASQGLCPLSIPGFALSVNIRYPSTASGGASGFSGPGYSGTNGYSGPSYPTYSSGPSYPTFGSGPSYPTYGSGPSYPTYSSGPNNGYSGPSYPTYGSGPSYPTYSSGPNNGYSGPSYPTYSSGPSYPAFGSGPNNGYSGPSYPTYGSGSANGDCSSFSLPPRALAHPSGYVATVTRGRSNRIRLPGSLHLPDRTRFSATLRRRSGGSNYTVERVTVTLQGLRHTYSGDMRFSLSHGGVTVHLLNFECGSNNYGEHGHYSVNMHSAGANYTFTDGAPSRIRCAHPIAGGTYSASSPLAAFANQSSSAGPWVLSHHDRYGGDTGFLDDVVLTVTHAPRTPQERAQPQRSTTVYEYPAVATLMTLPASGTLSHAVLPGQGGAPAAAGAGAGSAAVGMQSSPHFTYTPSPFGMEQTVELWYSLGTRCHGGSVNKLTLRIESDPLEALSLAQLKAMESSLLQADQQCSCCSKADLVQQCMANRGPKWAWTCTRKATDCGI